jgi:hypothetical protein
MLYGWIFVSFFYSRIYWFPVGDFNGLFHDNLPFNGRQFLQDGVE